MTVTPADTGHTTRLTNGEFSIPSGVGALGGTRPTGGSRVVRCRGNARSCQARISLAGGSHNRKIVIRLTDTNLASRSVKAPAAGEGMPLTCSPMASSFEVVAEYVVTLNAGPEHVLRLGRI